MSRVQYDELVSALPRARTMWVEDVRHGYCTSAKDCDRVADIMSSIMAEVEK